MIKINSRTKTEFAAYQDILETPEAAMLTTLKTLFASESRLYTKLWNYRWNMREDHLHALKALFDSQIELLAELYDSVTEKLRQTNTNTAGSMSEFVKQGRLRRTLAIYPDAEAMLIDLINEHERIQHSLCISVKGIVAEPKNQANINFLTELMHAHEKLAWALQQYLQN